MCLTGQMPIFAVSPGLRLQGRRLTESSLWIRYIVSEFILIILWTPQLL